MCLLILAGAAPRLAAQTTTPRADGPFAGLFGGVSQDNQTLSVRGSGFAAYQDVLLPPAELQQEIALDPRFQQTGTISGATGSVSYGYNHKTEGTTLSVNGDAAVTHYFSSSDFPQSQQLAFLTGVHLATKLSPKVSFFTTDSLSYLPFYNFAPFASGGQFQTSPLLSTPEFGFGAAPLRTLFGTATAGITDSLTKRSSVNGDVIYIREHYLDQGSGDFSSVAARIYYHYQIFRTLGFHAGYTATQSYYHGVDQGQGAGLQSGYDIGLDFADATTIRFTPHTTASLGAALSAVKFQGATNYAVTGHADIVHTMGRTWTTSAAYFRSFGFTSLFLAPVLSDNVNGTLNGLIARNASWTNGVGWSRGQIGFSGSYYTSETAFSTLNVGITGPFGAYVQYGYYYYEVPPGSTRLDLGSKFGRQSVSAGLVAWVPIIGNRRNRS
jgi:hypothetical protein